MKKWIGKHRIGLSLVPVILVMVMIFCFSAQQGETSGALSGRMTRWVIGIFDSDFGNRPIDQQESIVQTLSFILRKGAHFSEFALLGFFLMLHIRQLQTRVPVVLPWLWAWGIGTLYAVSDEIHQGFVGGRYPAVTDVMIDSAGAATGVAILLLILQIYACNLRKKDL